MMAITSEDDIHEWAGKATRILESGETGEAAPGLSLPLLLSPSSAYSIPRW